MPMETWGTVIVTDNALRKMAQYGRTMLKIEGRSLPAGRRLEITCPQVADAPSVCRRGI